MKKLTTITLTAITLFTLTACGNHKEETTVETQPTQIIKINDNTAVEKNVTEDTTVEDNENYYSSDETIEEKEEPSNTQTMDNAQGYANAMTVDPSQIGVGLGGSGFKDGTYFQLLGGKKVGVNGFSFYVISHATGDCIKVTCSSDNYQKAFAFADYMNELAPNGKTNNGLKSNFDYYMNN